MGTTLKFLSENTVRKCTFGNAARAKQNKRLTEMVMDAHEKESK